MCQWLCHSTYGSKKLEMAQWLWSPNVCNSPYYACGHAHVARMGKWPWCCTSTCQEDSNKLDLELICRVVAEFWHPLHFGNPYHTHGDIHVAPKGKWPWCCTSTGQDGSDELDLRWIRPVVAEFEYPQGYQMLITPLGMPMWPRWANDHDVAHFTPHWPVSSSVLGCEENLYFERWNSWTHPPI